MTYVEKLIPTKIPTLSNVVLIASGDNQSFAVDEFDQLYIWRLNVYQVCGLAQYGWRIHSVSCGSKGNYIGVLSILVVAQTSLFLHSFIYFFSLL
jgi:alpha-tubulin suppressor-like RCC1 family protein